MKKKYQNPKFKRYCAQRARSEEKKRRRSKKIIAAIKSHL